MHAIVSRQRVLDTYIDAQRADPGDDTSVLAQRVADRLGIPVESVCECIDEDFAPAAA